jgi:integrase
MPGKQAKTLSLADVNDLLVFASCIRNPLRNRVIVLLSAKAGLRASEIASLTWDMVLDPTGQISGIIELRDHAAKKGSGRCIPMHPDLRSALADLRHVVAHSEYVVTSERGGAMTPSSCGSTGPSKILASRAARRIQAEERLSPVRLDWCTRSAARCATSSCWLGIGRSRPRSGTSMAIATLSANWSR